MSACVRKMAFTGWQKSSSMQHNTAMHLKCFCIAIRFCCRGLLPAHPRSYLSLTCLKGTDVDVCIAHVMCSGAFIG